MNRMEVAAWIQVAVGVLALVITALTATPALNALVQASMGAGLPGSFQSAQGALQLFVVVLIMATSLVFVSIGVAVIIGRLFIMLGATAPYYAAFCVVIAMLLVSSAATIGLMKLRFWLWPLLQAILCLILAGQAQVDSAKKEAFWSFMIIGTAICFVTAAAAANLF